MADALQRAAKETAASKQIGPNRWQLILQNWCGKTNYIVDPIYPADGLLDGAVSECRRSV